MGRVFLYIVVVEIPDVIVTVTEAGTVTNTVPGVDEMYVSQNDEAVCGSRVVALIARRQLSKGALIVRANSLRRRNSG
jgi:hypothetical protein